MPLFISLHLTFSVALAWANEVEENFKKASFIDFRAKGYYKNNFA